MGKPNSAMGRSRDLGIPGGPGKGDKSRVTNQSAYAQNFDEINWGPPKVPWKRMPETYAEEAEWPDVMGVGGKVVNDLPVTNDIIRE